MTSDSGSSSVARQIEEEYFQILRPLSDFAAASIVIPVSVHSVSEDLLYGLFVEPDYERWVAF